MTLFGYIDATQVFYSSITGDNERGFCVWMGVGLKGSSGEKSCLAFSK